MENPMYAMAYALTKDEKTSNKMEMADANSAEQAVKIEEDLNWYWYELSDSGINYYAHKMSKEAGKHSSDATKQQEINNKFNDYQAEYNKYSTEAQERINSQNGSVKAAQGQTQTDGSNLSNMVASGQSMINGLMSALGNMLGQITA